MTEINELLFTHQVVRRLHLDMDAETFRYDLLMELSKGDTEDVISVLFENVSRMRLGKFGGGMTVFQHLTVRKDESGWEGSNYVVKELEEEEVEFYCAEVTVL